MSGGVLASHSISLVYTREMVILNSRCGLVIGIALLVMGVLVKCMIQPRIVVLSHLVSLSKGLW